MTFKLYNTLSRTVEELRPVAPPRITIYACGPTVRNYAHVGNFRTFLTVDLLRRYLEHRGQEVFLMLNVTDVDDRTIKDALEAGRTLTEHTAPYIEAFFQDREYLRIEPAQVHPQATKYIDHMVELVEGLIERGVAYQSEDGSVYFSVKAFETYGRLSRIDRRQLKHGARVDSDEYAKDDVRDFALWKAVAPADEETGAVWEAPFGRGRPGWHLECSVMSLTELERRFGIQTLDIHAGGVDLIFPHHENEIAQSEALTGCPFANHWLHGEFLTFEGTKMSKRYGNILTVRDLREEGVDAGTIRLMMFQTHYRQQLNFSDQALRAATEGSERLADFRRRLVERADGAPGADSAWSRALLDGFNGAMDDDLNSPRALGALFAAVREANRSLGRGDWGSGEASGALAAFDRIISVLDVLPSESEFSPEEVRWIEGRIQEREEARKARDFARADAIRDEIHDRGFELEDSPEGTRWRRRGS